MRLLTLMDLIKMSWMELYELMLEIMKLLPELPIGSKERDTALTNLRNICNIMTKRELSRGCSP